jgi:hypothetical protein
LTTRSRGDITGYLIAYTDTGWLNIRCADAAEGKPEITPIEPDLDNTSEGKSARLLGSRQPFLSV